MAQPRSGFYICKGNFSVQFNTYLKKVDWAHWHFVLGEMSMRYNFVSLDQIQHRSWLLCVFCIVYIHRFLSHRIDQSSPHPKHSYPEIDDHNTFPTFHARKKVIFRNIVEIFYYGKIQRNFF